MPLPQVGLQGPGPGALADLFSLTRDVDFARRCAAEYASWSARGPADTDGPVPQALWNAGAISYRRAFNSGRGHLAPKASRFRLEDVVLPSLSDEQRKTQEEVREMASKHVAHRVGEHEGAVVVALLAPPLQERAILGVGNLGAHMLGPTTELAEQLVDLCEVVLEVLDRETQGRSDQLLANLRETADLDALYAQATTPELQPGGAN